MLKINPGILYLIILKNKKTTCKRFKVMNRFNNKNKYLNKWFKKIIKIKLINMIQLKLELEEGL